MTAARVFEIPRMALAFASSTCVWTSERLTTNFIASSAAVSFWYPTPPATPARTRTTAKPPASFALIVKRMK